MYSCYIVGNSEPHAPYLEAPSGEGAGKDDLLGCLGDVYEAATARLSPWEAVHIYIAFLVHL
jgi:hypothetical protein